MISQVAKIKFEFERGDQFFCQHFLQNLVNKMLNGFNPDQLQLCIPIFSLVNDPTDDVDIVWIKLVKVIMRVRG